MRRTLLLICILLLFAGSGAAITSYDIQLDGDDARVNASFELYSDGKKINYWETSWSLPENSEVLSIKDSQGEIEDYSLDGTTLTFETNQGPRREKEVVDIQFVVHNVVAERYYDLKLVKLQLSGFHDNRPDVPDEVTQAVVTSDERILSESHTFGFDNQLKQHTSMYSGEGPLNIQLAVSDGGEQYEHYALFGEANLTEADNMYWLVPAITGFVSPVNKHPVIVLPDNKYDRDVDTWSAGQYRNGGLIFLRESTTKKNDMSAIVLHEVMHAFNEDAVRWAKNGLSWFDEGTAKYVEYLVKKEKNLRQPEIFGEEQTWVAPCEDSGGRCRYTLPPRGTPEQLWNYYTSSSKSMYTWKPSTSATAQERRFGYAYSELLIRNHVRKNDFEALYPTYETLLDREQSVTDPEEATNIVLNEMGTDFRPCYKPRSEELRNCLDNVNSMDPAVPDSITVSNVTKHIDIKPIKRPKTPSTIDMLKNVTKGDSSATMTAIERVLYDIGMFFTDVINNLFKRS